MVFVYVVKSEQVLSVILVSSLNIVVVIYLFELFLVNRVVLVEVVFYNRSQSIFCALFNFMVTSTFLTEKLSELFERQLSILVNIVLVIELVNALFSIWFVDEINIFELGF